MNMLDLQALTEKIFTQGPDRVVVSADGDAVPYPIIKALADEFFPDFIFVREDGWSLGASKDFHEVAFKMWRDQWVGFFLRPSLKLQPMSAYDERGRMKAKTIKLSVCECGFPALADEVALGTEYEIEPGLLRTFHWICGGCGKAQHLECVFVHPRLPGQKGGYLPLDLFLFAKK